MKSRLWMPRLGMTALLATTLGACATTTGSAPVEVSRFHLGAPLERGTLTTEPFPGAPPANLEFRNYAAAVEGEAFRNGFGAPATGTVGQYVATVGFNRMVQEGAPRSSGLSIGLGGGGYSGGGYRGGGGVGLGGGISFPIGKRRVNEVVVTQLVVTIRRRSDAVIIWEGRAETAADGTANDAQPDVVAGKLAHALFQGFPGESGRSITVR